MGAGLIINPHKSKKPLTRIGLLGCGNIGRIIASRAADTLNIVAVYDIDISRAQRLAEQCNAEVCTQFKDFITKDFTVLVEAASVQAASEYAEDTLRHDKDLVILSVGALADSSRRSRILNLARQRSRCIHVPSGAIAGLDGLRAAAIAGIDHLTLRTTKNPRALGVQETSKTCLFKGSASESIVHFPRNINVAVSLSIAANVEAQVEIWSDPGVEKNIHEVLARGDFGCLELKLSNEPCPDNPQTSYLAALSVLALLHGLDEALRVGV